MSWIKQQSMIYIFVSSFVAYVILNALNMGRWSYVPLSMLLVFGAFLVDKLKPLVEQGSQIKETIDKFSQLKEEIDQLRKQFHATDVSVWGKVLFYEGEYIKAASIFEEVVRESPTPENLYWLGLSFLRADEPRKALPYLREAIEKKENPEVLKILGETEYRLGNWTAAEECFCKAIEKGVKNVEETKLLLAKARLQSDPEAGKKTLIEIVHNNPRNANAINLLVDTLIDEENYDEAVEICDQALEFNPRNWSIYPRRAEALLLRDKPGDKERAQEDLRKARLANPRDFNIYRVIIQDLIKKALETPEESEELLHEVIKTGKEGIEQFSGGLKA
ncbi:MAG: hypothetical protein DRN00_01280 [Thermoplasmata archaeon]|nr:MAG: hypothetical protein DRN00_01280 [Thermoplasmata archaeon]